MLIEHLRDQGATADGCSIGDLDDFYRAARGKFDADPASVDRARRRVVALQGGDEGTLALWRVLVAESERHFAAVYELLGVKLTDADYYGESFYNPFLADVVEELTAKGLIRVGDGAVCAFPAGFTNREGEPLPLIVRKGDGGYGYPSTDLATLRYWTRDRGATDLLYFVGSPQALHFRMVFATATDAGRLGEGHRAEHVGFGSVPGEDGKLLRSRAGGSVKLVDLLREAVRRAGAVVAERSDLDPEHRAAVSRAVGIGAVKYADLSGDREKGYLFAWDRMPAMEGNTSVYLQYANAWVRSVPARAGREVGPGTPVLLTEPAERALALKVAQLPAAVAAAIEGYAPHKLCGYLYETAVAFAAFYESCPIVRAPDERTRDSRLVPARLTSRVLVPGLGLLGIEAPNTL